MSRKKADKATERCPTCEGESDPTKPLDVNGETLAVARDAIRAQDFDRAKILRSSIQCPTCLGVGKVTERVWAFAKLHQIIGVKSEIHTIVRHVSRSGMQREISAYAVDREDGSLVCLDFFMSKLLGDRIGKHGGLVVGGCGMDMAWNQVYRLGRAMWPNGTPSPHGTRNREPDTNGGYALVHRSL